MGTSEPRLLLGLVTHARSRFNGAGEATDQVHALARALRAHGFQVEVLVSDRNDAEPLRTQLDARMLRRSALRQARLEHRWRRYLAAGGGRPARSAAVDWVLAKAMAAKRVVRNRGSAGVSAATRLLNIDLSHLRVMQAAIDADADWALILEDDAVAGNLVEAAAVLAAILTTPLLEDVAFVNCSESIDLAALRVVGLVAAEPWAIDGTSARVVPTALPITNTVCANLYRGDFVRLLSAGIETRGLTPVVPIDWRINEIVMDLWASGDLGTRACAWVRPGLFVQRSMHEG